MSDLRALLERESERVSLAAGAADRMFERGRRRERTRRITALALGIVLFAIVLAIVRSSLPAGDRRPEPATPTPTSPGDVAGTYTVLLPIGDADVERLGINGPYTMHLGADGRVELMGPRRFNGTGLPISFDLDRGMLTTDLFVGAGCAAPGEYRVALDTGSLTLDPVDDPCEMRTVLLSTRPWTVAAVDTTTDRLEGDWVSMFPCEQMVQAVDRAPVPPDAQAFWNRAFGSVLGSDDPSDPCSGVTDRLTYRFRFDDGRLLIFDGPARLAEGFDGAYEIRGNVVEIRDATTENIEGTYRFRFELRGDRMIVDLVGRGGRDPFFVSAWESAPLIRASV
jgi:hypothetical protein